MRAIEMMWACLVAVAMIVLDVWMTARLSGTWQQLWVVTFNIIFIAAAGSYIFRMYLSRRTAERGFMRFSRDPMSLYDLQGKFVDVNEAGEQLIGWGKKERVSTYHDDLFPDNRKHRARKAFALAREGRPQHFDTVCIRKDGTFIEVEVSYIPWLWGSKIQGVYGVMKNITELKRNRERLEQSEKLAVVGELAASIAHEIRNPLTSLRGFVQLTRANAPPTYTEIMLSEIDRIHEITSELLLMGRPNARDMTNKRLLPLFESILTLVNTHALLLNIEIDLRVWEGAEDAVIRCDDTKLKQVFLNVLKNAMEAMPKGGNITIDLERDSDSIHVKITDTGVGIPKEKLDQLGQAFFTTKEKGTGLGLMISYSIIEQHQGKMVIESEENVGTTVHLQLPLSADATAEEERGRDPSTGKHL